MQAVHCRFEKDSGFAGGYHALCRKQTSLAFRGWHLDSSIPALMLPLKGTPWMSPAAGEVSPWNGVPLGQLELPSTATQETPQPRGQCPAQIQSPWLRKSGGWQQLGVVLPRGLHSPFMTLLGQLVAQSTPAVPYPYRASKSAVTTSLPNVPWNTSIGAGKVDTFSLLVHLHIKKQCPAQNIIRDWSHHFYQPTVMSQNTRQTSCPCRAWVSWTLYHCISYLSQKAFFQVNSWCVLMYCLLKPGL